MTEDIQSTRGWQSKKAQHCTETIKKLKAAEDNNLDNLKWIYDYIGDIEFKSNYEEDEYDEDGYMIPISCTGNLYYKIFVFILISYFK